MWIPFLLAPLLVLFAGPFAAHLYLNWAGHNSRTANRVFWPLAGLITLGLGILIAYTFGDFFPGPGCFISMTMPIAALATFILVRIKAKRSTIELPRKSVLLAMWLIPLLLLSAPVVSFAYSRGCDAVNRGRAETIIRALQAYRQERSAYPGLIAQTGLDFLIPEYLENEPKIACFPQQKGNFLSDGWSLYPCKNGLILMVPVLGSDSQQTYNLETGEWGFGSAFDGYCR